MKATVQFETEEDGMNGVTRRQSEDVATALANALEAHCGQLTDDPLIVLAKAVTLVSGDDQHPLEGALIKAAADLVSRNR